MPGLTVGQAAPSFSAETDGGQTITLEQFRGKWVLIDFWATWCGPCRAEFPLLKKVYAAHGKNERFMMISLSVDKTIRAPMDYARQHQLDWLQGFLPGGWEAPAMKAYRVRGIPAVFLITPDGRLAASGLRGPQIEAAVAQALANDSPQTTPAP
jgi:thiol-disulfide isomerase/thioredoxin